ncbi:MAG: hypothetical protein ABI361_09600 [Nitrososphaera sp.]|jgi:hypothetical protein
MKLLVITDIITKKTYLMTFVAWAIILADVVFGTFLDRFGKPLDSNFGVALFIAMTAAVFFAGLYLLRDCMKVLRKDLEGQSFFNRLYRATPKFLYALLAIFAAIIVEMVVFSQYSTALIIPLVLISGIVPMLFFGFRTFKFLSWFKSSSNKRRNAMILAFAVSSMLFAISVTTTTVLDTKVFVFSRPQAITPAYQSSNDITITLSGTENLVLLYVFIVPVVLAIPAETVAVAFFLRFFKDQIGRATFWAIVILPPFLNFFGIFAPQLLTTGSAFVYADPRFIYFRIIGTAGWVAADFVILFAYLLVARTVEKQVGSAGNKKIINYLIIAALSTILVSPTANNWIPNASYPPFGAIQRALAVLGAFMFTIGIYAVSLSLVQDAELRNLARRYAKDYALLDTLGNAQMEAEVTRKVVKLVRQQADVMERETGVESEMTDDNGVKEYLELVIREAREKKALKSGRQPSPSES